MAQNIASLRALASELLGVDEPFLCMAELSRDGALYVSEPKASGRSILLALDGTVLFAAPAVSFTEHLREFRAGRRTSDACQAIPESEA